MTMALANRPEPGFARAVWLLLRASRKRAAGRLKRQRELMRRRTGKKTTLRWGWVGFVASIFLTAALNGIAALVVFGAVMAGERAEPERYGKMVVSQSFREDVIEAERAVAMNPSNDLNRNLDSSYRFEALRISIDSGKSEHEVESKLRATVAEKGSAGLVSVSRAVRGIRGLLQPGAYPALLGSLVLFWWAVMVIFQGEGLELDLQRRRHPMWEWLFSHPVSPGAIFMAEMLSPIAANPIYCTVPLFPGILYGLTYGPGLGLVAALVIGVPVAIAAACTGKALEIGAILRFSPRTRGAMIGLMSWIGYASMMLFFFGLTSLSKVVGPLIEFLRPLTILPWPWLGFFLGQGNGRFSFPMGMFTCWMVCGIAIACAVGFSRWAAQQGLSGNFGRTDSAPSPSKVMRVRFGKDPLYRKELLWFARDRSAIVQTILVPITVASFQLFNMRGLVGAAQNQWNYLCGAAILFGTYFLWVLGPKSLASEGSALWIALTWPRGLESLLKAKAWLWSLISSAIVVMVLLYSAYLFPAQSWKILLVGIGWFFFGRSMAEKAVTLVQVPSSSGEPEKISRTRQWSASLGMLTFAIGILTQQWHIAIMGIVYSYITAAAMWENFRARLPFLYDPWSEKLPPPPTLMHAMIAISVLVESGAVLTGMALAVVNHDAIATVQVVLYGVCATVVSLFLWKFLSGRGVPAREVWCWQKAEEAATPSKAWWSGDGTHGKRFFVALLIGLGGGLVLGLFAHAYLAVMLQFPSLAEIINKGKMQMHTVPGLQTSYAVIATCFAPFAEEYLFRGLLFRALDREWGGWRAVVGSGAFFAIYHPLLSWLPVGLLGMTNALLFKKTGRLAPAVLLHMVYNIVVLA